MLKLISPAKINLYLQVVSRRPDGYHEIASLFQTVDLHDTITFALASNDHLTCTDAALPVNKSNLIIKAADLFRQKTGLSFGLHAHLEKRIPTEAGLGGGSSNAATTLWALNQLLGRPASLGQLIAWSAEIGSDISFFLSTGTAHCTGRGEIIEPVNALNPTKVWLVKPLEGLSTPSVFKKLDLANLTPRPPRQFLDCFLKGSPIYFNDLEEPAFALMPALKVMKQRLQASGFTTVLMSGSGTTFFCLGDVEPPSLPGAFQRQAAFINRPQDEWYSC